MSESEYTFTVVTVTHDRAHLLPRVYACLRDQTLRDFEWIVVDDGSTDGTPELVSRWVEEEGLPIRYFRHEESQGWHVGFNRAARESRGRYLNNLDSDDWYPPDALERWHELWQGIPEERRDGYFDVVGLCAFADGTVVGDRFPEDELDTDHLELRLRWRVRRDKAVSCRADISREFPYPEDLGRFVTISMTWNRIAPHYTTRCVNQVLKYVEYQPDGLTARTVRVRAGSPDAARTYYREVLESGRPMTLRERWRTYANYIRYTLHGRRGVLRAFRELPFSPVWPASLPAGLGVYVRDRWIMMRTGD